MKKSDLAIIICALVATISIITMAIALVLQMPFVCIASVCVFLVSILTIPVCCIDSL